MMIEHFFIIIASVPALRRILTKCQKVWAFGDDFWSIFFFELRLIFLLHFLAVRSPVWKNFQCVEFYEKNVFLVKLEKFRDRCWHFVFVTCDRNQQFVEFSVIEIATFVWVSIWHWIFFVFLFFFFFQGIKLKIWKWLNHFFRRQIVTYKRDHMFSKCKNCDSWILSRHLLSENIYFLSFLLVFLGVIILSENKIQSLKSNKRISIPVTL